MGRADWPGAADAYKPLGHGLRRGLLAGRVDGGLRVDGRNRHAVGCAIWTGTVDAHEPWWHNQRRGLLAGRVDGGLRVLRVDGGPLADGRNRHAVGYTVSSEAVGAHGP